MENRCRNHRDSQEKPVQVHREVKPDATGYQYQVYLVIPAYEPDERLLELLKRTAQIGMFRMIVVNDGSGTQYDPIFREAGKYATVIGYAENQGKGAALKTAYSFLYREKKKGMIVTADADGQHSLSDIISVAYACRSHPEELILGSRNFSGKVPMKSRLGNRITRGIFRLQSGCKVRDTQTGLRAFSTEYLPFMMQVEGMRYEYEMNVLLFWCREHPVREVPIETIYLEKNRSSHFRPIKDAARIYREILKFGGVSLLSFGIDYTLYGLLSVILPFSAQMKILMANTVARCMSGAFNYEMNRRYVFRKKEGVVKSGIQYLLLAVCIYILSTAGISVLYTMTHLNLFLLKIVVDAGLFFVSWIVQKKLIFKKEMIGCTF